VFVYLLAGLHKNYTTDGKAEHEPWMIPSDSGGNQIMLHSG